MKLPENIIIACEKITQYLLVFKKRNWMTEFAGRKTKFITMYPNKKGK